MQDTEAPRRGAGVTSLLFVALGLSAGVLLLQTPLLSQTGSVTVVGALLVAVVALYLGLVTPKHSVEELRTRLHEREEENATLNVDLVKRIEENAELRGELAALRREMEGLRSELGALRAELGRRRAES